MRRVAFPPLFLAAALMPACVDTSPSAYPDLSGDYVGTGVWRSDNLHNLSVLVLTVAQDADSIHGSGLISGMVTSDEGTAEDCSLTGDDAEGLMYFGRKRGGDS